MRRVLPWLAAALLLACVAPAAARAEADEVRFAQQFSLGYLQFDVIKHQHTLEKRAAELGLPDLKVTWTIFNGPDMMNDALLANATDIVAGGVPGLLTIWGRTFGTRQEVRGVSAMTEAPSLLNTSNPNIHSIGDLTETDRIALPAVKVSIQAMVLQMASAQMFGRENAGRFNGQTMSLSPADSSTGLLSGSGGFDCAFTPPPFPQLQLKNPKIHTVLSSFDVIGKSTASALWTSRRFHDANPKIFQALLDSLKQASDFINSNRREALQYYIEDAHSTLSVDDLIAITSGPHSSFGVVPEGVMKFATFMTEIGALKHAPESWKDVFFPEIADQPGS